MVTGTRQERLDFVLGVVPPEGAYLHQLQSAIMRKWGLTHETSSQYLRDLVDTGELVNKGGRFYRPSHAQDGYVR